MNWLRKLISGPDDQAVNKQLCELSREIAANTRLLTKRKEYPAGQFNSSYWLKDLIREQTRVQERIAVALETIARHTTIDAVMLTEEQSQEAVADVVAAAVEASKHPGPLAHGL